MGVVLLYGINLDLTEMSFTLLFSCAVRTGGTFGLSAHGQWEPKRVTILCCQLFRLPDGVLGSIWGL